MADARTDVLIVGGGVLGLAHAVAALRAGHRVTLCERTRVARGASVRNFGMVWPIGQPAGPNLEIARRSRQLWTEVAELAGFRCRPTGSLHLAYADDEWSVLGEFAAESPLDGLELLTPEAVRQHQPAVVGDGLRGGLFSPHEANVDPPVAITALHDWIEAQGATVRRGCPTTRIESGVATFADGTRCTADQIVVCTGDDFATLFPDMYADSDLQRCKLQMLALGPQPPEFQLGPMLAAGLTLLHYRGFATCPTIGRLRARLQAEHGECIERGIHVLVSQGDDGRLIVGDSHQYGLEFPPGLDTTTERHILGYLGTFLRPPQPAVVHRWSGCYALRKGGESTFRARPLPGVEVVTGVGGSGMTRSMALGEQTVRLWRMG